MYTSTKSRERLPSLSPGPASSVTGDTMVVLLVDDDGLDRTLVRRSLADQGAGNGPEVVIKIAKSLHEATKLLERHGPVDVCLLDLGLPDSTGLSTLDRFLARFPDIPVVVLSGVDCTETMANAVARGAQDFIPKNELSRPLLLRTLRHARERECVRRRMQSENSSLEKHNENLALFAGTASHELKSPVGSILMHLFALESGGYQPEDKRVAHALGRIRCLAQRSLETVDEVLSYVRTQYGRVNPASVEVKEIVEAVLEEDADALAACGAEVHAEVEGSVTVDPDGLRLVLKNLVGNSIKYRDPERALQISIRGRRGDPVEGVDAYILEVRDSGRGFSAEQSRGLFDCFRRLSNVGKTPGTGLGLAICRSVIEAHEGRIEASGREGEGATFRIILPASRNRAHAA